MFKKAKTPAVTQDEQHAAFIARCTAIFDEMDCLTNDMAVADVELTEVENAHRVASTKANDLHSRFGVLEAELHDLLVAKVDERKA